MRKPRPLFRRRLGRVEMLEGRRMLATDLAQIAGVVMNDLENDGVGNVVAVGQQVELFLDNGKSTFGADDTSLGTTTTNGSGQYFFNGLVAGNYFVRINPTAGTQTLTGANVSALINFSAGEAMESTNLTIDDFNTAQSANVSTAGSTTATSADDGGVRDLYASIASGTSQIDLVSDFVGTGILNLASTVNVRGVARAVWDGADGNAATIRLYSGAGNYSEVDVTILDTDAAIDGDATESISIPFTSLVTVAGTGVNLSNVGAIEVEFDFDSAGFESLDAQVDVVGVAGVAVTLQSASNDEASAGLADVESRAGVYVLRGFA